MNHPIRSLLKVKEIAEKINDTIHHSHVHEELCNLNEKA
jgi:hypothetical protein